MAGRYFLGVDVPADVCGPELIALQKRLEPHLDVKRWYNPDQLHLTVQFMGNLEAAQVTQLIELVEAATRGLPAFELELGEVGWFPRAKVVWCGVQGAMNALQELQRNVVQALSTAFQVDSYNHGAFRPHITLGRLHSADVAFRPESVASPPSGMTWRVGGLHLYESVSAGKNGPQYPIRHRFALGM
ncbi:RNA 2',3'-cyclic phosphodiesterase [Tumebacillus permanentifrigoris]|uniref:RNA 2',3'-cyclic phosphodiesterase n=1 Tax=Tumebacillus permanentifrigoris TaxID=378543 RepID=A0A316D4H0_9BACL|nr:RNA 2',3'-cyclic phosphodiesterase [Tumebacillus permanentifrigoris]PWK07470.1 2'-5' RNA ligase [Tumebacillus permanentifrigoris]